MKLTTILEETGKLNAFDISEDIELLETLPKSKPSTRIIRTKKGKKAIEALKDLAVNHNNSWSKEVDKTIAKQPNTIAIEYRGTKITYAEFGEMSDSLAKALVFKGVKKGDEIPVLMDNSPEFVILLKALNKIGASINVLSEALDKEYLSEILDDCSKKIFIATDRLYPIVKDVVETKEYENKMLCSLSTFLPKEPEKTDNYIPALDKYFRYPDMVPEFKNQDSQIESFNDVVNMGRTKSIEVIDDSDFNTHFLTTYSSGSTINGRPKQIMHSNRSLITMGKFHDPDLSGNPPTPGLKVMAYIHTESNTDIIPSISDPLIQGWTVVPEPEYGRDSFLDILYMDKPNYVNATTSFWVKAAKMYMAGRYNELGVKKEMPWLFTSCTGGEICEKGAENYINKWFKDAKAGSGFSINGFHLPWAPIGRGGGDCEHGALCYSLWNKFFEVLDKMPWSKKYGSDGMNPVSYCTVTSFRLGPDGKYYECDYDEAGLLAINSLTSYTGYKGNKQAVKDSIITDNFGREWHSCNVYGFVDKKGRAHMLDRYNSKLTINNFAMPKCILEELVLCDGENVLSCTLSVVKGEDGDDIPVINFERRPDSMLTDDEVMDRIIAEFKDNNIPDFVINRIRFRVFGGEKEFPLRASGKRAFNDLNEMQLEDTIEYQNARGVSRTK